MSFTIEGKIALVTGGASGIGLTCVKELLRNGLRGITIADINKKFGDRALEEIKNEFGANKAIFVETDVSNAQSFEEAFKKCIAYFNNLDIVINNAGIVSENVLEKATAVNFNGVARGTILALENYIPKYRTDKNGEGVIVNVASIAGVNSFNCIPIYTGTKFAIVGMSTSFGDIEHYNRTKVKVLTMCPGITNTPIVDSGPKHILGPAYLKLFENFTKIYPTQEPEFVAESMIKIVKHAKSGTVWVAEGSKGPYQYMIPQRETFLSNTLS